MTEEYQELLIRGLTKFKEWEFSTVPNENEIEHIFSDKYLKAKEKLLNKVGRSYWKYVNTVAKKAAIIILTLIIAFSSLITVDSIRERIVDFVVNVYKTFTEIESNYDSEKHLIDTYYTLDALPKDFHVSLAEQSAIMCTFLWSNHKKQDISIIQSTLPFSHIFNSEECDIIEVIINDTPCLVCKNDSDYFCYWEYDGYRFELIYPIDLGEEFMSEVVGKLVEFDPEDINN